MAERQQIKKPVKRVTKEESDQLAEEDAAQAPATNADAVKQATDDLLDEIDTILEETAVMTNYVQRGGE